MLESGDKTENIGDEFKTIRLIMISKKLVKQFINSFPDMKNHFGFPKKI
jgi:hypothetical protein